MKNAVLLIVEDEALTALNLRRQFEEHGHRVCKTVPTGEAALQCMETETPDVLLMDIHLKGAMNGIETAHKIKAIKDIPIIFMSGYSPKEIAEQLKGLQPAGFFDKPIYVKKIADLIDSL